MGTSTLLSVGSSLPVLASTRNTSTLSPSWLATRQNRPVGSTAKLRGVLIPLAWWPAAVSFRRAAREADVAVATIAGYNNFYEFGTGKEDPSHNAPKWHVPDPWSVSIEGAGADKPQTLDLTAIMKIAPLEERIYRHRCVEAWSVVVPWIGYSLSTILKQVQPNSNARRPTWLP